MQSDIPGRNNLRQIREGEPNQQKYKDSNMNALQEHGKQAPIPTSTAI